MMHQFKLLATSVAVAAAPAAMIALSAGAGTAAAAPVQPNPNGATKVQLSTTNRGCNFNQQESGTGMGTGSGFAIINTTGSNSPNGSNGSNKVIAEVHLTNAAPNTTYNVRLIELPSGSTCPIGAPGVVGGTIQTNAAGNGNVNLQEDVVPNATGAWVSVVGPDLATGPDLYTSGQVVPV